MKATFKPTNYTFDFDDTYFVQIGYAGAIAEGGHKVVACFQSQDDATTFAAAQVKRYGIAAARVFTRDERIASFYAD
jgi:hypothetical protein